MLFLTKAQRLWYKNLKQKKASHKLKGFFIKDLFVRKNYFFPSILSLSACKASFASPKVGLASAA